jgi:glycerol-3-phosphate dehydrogenase subunit B
VTRKAIVIGAGIAGTAAALELARRGLDVTVLVGPPGATQLSSGILDWEVWDGGTAIAPAEARPEPRDAVPGLLESLGGFVLAECTVATLAGVVREGAGRDRALLDLGGLKEGEVLLPRAMRHGWDADAIAWMLSASPLAQARKLVFRAAATPILRLSDERLVADAVLAGRHDDASRLGWLADRLRRAQTAATRAWLLPPWLGCEKERATELSANLGVPCGEIVVGLSGPYGFRFAAARNRAFARANVTAYTAFATAILDGESTVVVEVEGAAPMSADVAVIAAGGLLGGGIIYEPSEAIEGGELPLSPHPTVRSAIGDAPVGVHGAAFDLPGSLFGVAPENLAWPWSERGVLERAGVLVGEGGLIAGKQRVFAAGDLVADRPRTWLEAARSGLAVAAAAAASAS